jgi:hypothetical protein
MYRAMPWILIGLGVFGVVTCGVSGSRSGFALFVFMAGIASTVVGLVTLIDLPNWLWLVLVPAVVLFLVMLRALFAVSRGNEVGDIEAMARRDAERYQQIQDAAAAAREQMSDEEIAMVENLSNAVLRAQGWTDDDFAAAEDVKKLGSPHRGAEVRPLRTVRKAEAGHKSAPIELGQRAELRSPSHSGAVCARHIFPGRGRTAEGCECAQNFSLRWDPQFQ